MTISTDATAEAPLRLRKLIGLTAALTALTAGPALLATSGGSAHAATSSPAVPLLFPNSVFDQSVASWRVAANSSALVSNVVNQYQTNYGSIGVNRMPIFTVPANQPMVPVAVESGCWSFLASTGPVPIPPGAYNTNSSDDDLIVSQPSTGRAWELWKATQTNGKWSACWGGQISFSSSGIFPNPFGLSATGISYLATTITESDVASGQIDHAIAMQIVNCYGIVYPADRGDCTMAAGNPPEGSWLRLPASTPMPAGLTPFAQMVFRALQKYGAVVVDHAGAVMVEAENSADWAFEGNTGTDPITTSFAGEPQYAVMNNMPWAQLQVVTPPAA